MSLIASALVFVQPAFAQTDGGFDAPVSSGDRHKSSDAADPNAPWEAVPPSFVDPSPAHAPKQPMSPQTSSPREVLIIPAQDCGHASLILARVTRHLRDAEQSASYNPEAEDEYDDALQAITETKCAEGIKDLHAADKALRDSPTYDSFSSYAQPR
jgi:hypothetical protein